MTIQQLSVFIENKSGTYESIELIERSRYTADCLYHCRYSRVWYLPYHLLGTQTRIRRYYKEAESPALSDVFAITLDNQPGRAADAITIFSEAQIGITYLYSFLLGNKGILIFRTDNPDRAREVIILIIPSL